MKLPKITKEGFAAVISHVKLDGKIDLDFTYEVYEIAFESIKQLYEAKILTNYANVNHFDLAFYVLGEYFYSVLPRSKEEVELFNKSEEVKHLMASVAADKFISMSHLSYNERKIAHKHLPPISSLNLYLNFILNTLNSYEKNDPKSTLINDLLRKSMSLIKCVINLLMDGNESEAFSTWRTLHECECTLILLDKYGDPLIESYLKHMKYGLAYKGISLTKEEIDDVFVEIKETMRKHDLKSKDMKKFIEYGWLYDIPDIDQVENFKLNFRDGLQKISGLSANARRYEISSELIHSTPMLFYAVKENYYFLSLLSSYESFFRLEKIFVNILSKKLSVKQLSAYEAFRKVYYVQLINIHKREVETYKSWQLKINKK